MKAKHILLLLLCLFMAGNADAQILKKLKKKADKVFVNKKNKNDSIPEETTDEPTKEEKKALEGKMMGIFGGGLESLPDTYEFQYVIDMKMTTNKEEMDMQYFVQPNTTYFGNAIPQDKNNSIIVYDIENQAMVTFMENNGKKMAMKMRMPMSDEKMQALLKKQSDKASAKMKKANITPLPDKKILGYNCKGYQIADKDGVSKVWFTDEAPVSFVGMFASTKQMPKNLSGNMIPFSPKSMMLEMEYTSNKKKKDNMRMLCTSIEEKSFAIKRKEYKTGM